MTEGSEDKVLRLKKSFYELKQAPHTWYICIDKYFIDHEFRRTKSTTTLYIKTQGNYNTLIVSLYVDDLIYIGNGETIIREFKEEMMQTFEMTDLGLMHYFLDIEINQNEDGIFISQKKYIENLLRRFKLSYYKAVATPLVHNEKIHGEDGSREVDASRYRSLIRSILYLTATRPDIMYVTSLLSTFV